MPDPKLDISVININIVKKVYLWKLLMIWLHSFTRRIEMKNIIFAILIVFGLSSFAQGDLIVLDFESLSAGGDDGPTYLGTSTYSEDGYTLNTTSEFGFVNMQSPYSTVLFSRYGNDLITIKKSDGEYFNLLSIEFYPYFASGDSIEIVGTFSDNSTITRSFPPYNGECTTLDFSDFDNLVSVSWNSSGQYSHFDNINLVPEPTSYFLLITGLFGILIKNKKNISV